MLHHIIGIAGIFFRIYIPVGLLCKTLGLSAKELWGAINIRGSYGQEFSVLFFDSQCIINTSKRSSEELDKMTNVIVVIVIVRAALLGVSISG